jgi:hypothetical protein
MNALLSCERAKFDLASAESALVRAQGLQPLYAAQLKKCALDELQKVRAAVGECERAIEGELYFPANGGVVRPRAR